MRGHTNLVYCATFSSGGTNVVSGPGGCTIRVWDVDTGNLGLGPLKMHTDTGVLLSFQAVDELLPLLPTVQFSYGMPGREWWSQNLSKGILY